MQVTIGGERLGAGKKMKVNLREYDRSTHDLSYVWKSTAAAGTLIPFMSLVALPGDTFDIKLAIDVLTHPTVGPLFGSYSVEGHLFQVPMRLYNAMLHQNMLGIGLRMQDVKLPLVEMNANAINPSLPIDNQQINPSCIFSYLGIRGLGKNADPSATGVFNRQFNAIPYLGYWDIYKNYFANKQESNGVVIHKNPAPESVTLTSADVKLSLPEISIPVIAPVTYAETTMLESSVMQIIATGLTAQSDIGRLRFAIRAPGTGVESMVLAYDIMNTWDIIAETGLIVGSDPTDMVKSGNYGYGLVQYQSGQWLPDTDVEPTLELFPLENIDTMRQQILSTYEAIQPFKITSSTMPPYGLPLARQVNGDGITYTYSKNFSQEGLALKTYKSDLFNNWMDTEWIDGPDGISEITAVDTSSGSFTIDELTMKRKVYDMLNRIAISGGSYDDWLDVNWEHERARSVENPVYLGGVMQTLAFQEVVSNSRSFDQPLGTLAGRGKIMGDQKGGKTIVKVDEPSYIMGIFCLTPKLDYSQGNQWDVNLRTMDDLHKPALDSIGFQDLVTDQLAWWDTSVDQAGSVYTNQYKSAGKQPAWLNYMTAVNVVRGNFAEQSQQMFMVLNRRYGVQYGATSADTTIKDLTTYIDPTKFNHIFADTRLDAQNFWVQIAVDIEARRKLSAKIMPNL